MLSRVSNNLIWMSRYMERGYSILRLLKVNYSAHQDSQDLFSWEPIIKRYGNFNFTCASDNSADCINHMIFDNENLNAITNLVTKSRENARSAQEHIPRELWLGINSYYLYLTAPALKQQLYENDPVVLLDKLLSYHLLHYGYMDITQERGPAYHFMNVGKFLERMIQILEITSMKLTEVSKTNDELEQIFHWKNLLLSVGAYQLFLKKYKSNFKEEHIIRTIFNESLFPKSLYYCINKLSRHIDHLIKTNELANNNLDFLLGKLGSTIKYTTTENIYHIGLDNFIYGIKNDIKQISLSINDVYLTNKP